MEILKTENVKESIYSKELISLSADRQMTSYNFSHLLSRQRNPKGFRRDLRDAHYLSLYNI